MKDKRVGKKYIIFKKDNKGEVTILSSPGLFISLKSHGSVKEIFTIKEAKQLKRELRHKYPKDWIYIYTVHTYCYMPILQSIENIKNIFFKKKY